MYIRKIVAAAGFACGAALAFAPLASADPAATDPMTNLLSSEISSLNSIFMSEATAAKVPTADITTPTGGFDTVLLADAPKVTDPGQLTLLDYYLYGVNPVEAGPASDPGSYNVFNGALTEYYDAYNVEYYAMLNGGALDTNAADYIGSSNAISHALATGSASGAANYFTQFGNGDLEGFYGIFPSASGSAAAGAATPTPITSLFDSEVASLNSQFESDAALAGVPSSDITTSTTPGTFDVVNPADVSAVQGNGTTPFDYLIYGVDPTKAGLAGDPGAYNLFNGAEAKFDDALNVAAYAMQNGGALDTNAADYIGNLPAGFANDTPAQAFEYFYNFAIGDLGGYFQTDLSGLDISGQSATELFTLLGSL